MSELKQNSNPDTVMFERHVQGISVGEIQKASLAPIKASQLLSVHPSSMQATKQDFARESIDSQSVTSK